MRHYIEDFRLEPFIPNFGLLGVSELVDFTEVLMSDLEVGPRCRLNLA